MSKFYKINDDLDGLEWIKKTYLEAPNNTDADARRKVLDILYAAYKSEHNNKAGALYVSWAEIEIKIQEKPWLPEHLILHKGGI